MEMTVASSAPSKLYALHLKLRPMQQGTLMPFNGELVHGALLNWLGTAAPDVVTWLHDGNKRRLFTCSSLQFPYTGQRMLDAERENVHLPLDPLKTYTVRITLLLGDLFPLFHSALMQFHAQETRGAAPPFMKIGKQLFLLEEVLVANDDPSGWVGYTSIPALVEKAMSLKLSKTETLTLEFGTLTTFNRSNSQSEGYGAHYALLPLPQFVFPNLVKRWKDIAPPELAGIIQDELIKEYIERDGIIIADYALKTHQVKFTTHTQSGFLGTCTYHLRGPDTPNTEAGPLTVRQQLFLLAQLAFYCGVGYKTSMGMGRTRPI